MNTIIVNLPSTRQSLQSTQSSNVIIVSKSIVRGGSNYNTITEGLLAVAQQRTTSRPVILIYPGDYTSEGTLTIPTNTSIKGLGNGRSVFVQGMNINFSSGINAINATAIEACTIEGLSVGGQTNIDYTAKTTNVFSIVQFIDCFLTTLSSIGTIALSNAELELTNTDVLGSLTSNNVGFLTIHSGLFSSDVTINTPPMGESDFFSVDITGTFTIVGPAFILGSILRGTVTASNNVRFYGSNYPF